MNNSKRQTITPSLTVKNTDQAIAFYTKVLGARVDGRPMRGPTGGVIHAELVFGNDMKIFLNDEFPEMGSHSPQHFGGTSVSLMLVVEEVDKTYEVALSNGSSSKMPPSNMFWGDRYACIVDPFGHIWGLCKQIEQLTPEQIEERAKELFKQPTHS
jgi:PhnB protein